MGTVGVVLGLSVHMENEAVLQMERLRAPS